MSEPRTLRLRTPPMKGDDVESWQRELRNQFDGMGIDYDIAVDGVYGIATRDATETLCYALGIEQDDLNTGVTPFIRSKIRNRDLTTDELRRFKEREGWRKRLRKKHAKPQRSGPQIALAEFAKYQGVTERPPGSNGNPANISRWQARFGFGRVPYCGIGCGEMLTRAGVKVTSRIASVALILEDGLNGRNGMRSCVFRRRTGRGSVSAGRPGDLAGLFGEGTHVAMIERRVPGGYWTREANTSPGNSGSQANGGGCWRRFRTDASIVYLVRPDWS